MIDGLFHLIVGGIVGIVKLIFVVMALGILLLIPFLLNCGWTAILIYLYWIVIGVLIFKQAKREEEGRSNGNKK